MNSFKKTLVIVGQVPKKSGFGFWNFHDRESIIWVESTKIFVWERKLKTFFVIFDDYNFSKCRVQPISQLGFRVCISVNPMIFGYPAIHSLFALWVIFESKIGKKMIPIFGGF